MGENPLVGVWRLVSCDAIRANGTKLPVYGRRPIGRLIYDSAGNMSVHIMRSGRQRSSSETKFGANDDEMKSAYEGYEAYFSTYAIDPHLQKVTHKVLGSLFPNWTGSIQTRYYSLDGDERLILSTEPPGSTPNGRPIVQLVWERHA